MPTDPQTLNIPRRICLDRFTPAERAIYDAVQAVEALAADVRLTDAVVLLQAARESVADVVDHQRAIVRRRVDLFCEHDTALDVHCCNCHSGFIFDIDHECPDAD